MAFLVFCKSPIFSQNIKIFGYVKDTLTGETLVGASVYASQNAKGCTTNSYGFYSLELPKNQATTLEISFVGYKNQRFLMDAARDMNLNFSLILNDTLATFEVVERKTTEIKHGFVSFPVETLKNMPSLAGEPDILKALSFLPGITTGVEGTSGLYVRGGSPDQNLILLDDATVYNTSHLFGFMSILNPNAIKSVNVYKGGFPARFGGRLSSVIDVTMKEGNDKKHQFEGSIGLINANIIAEGPIQKGKSSYMISGRSAYLTLLNALNRSSYLNGLSKEYANVEIYDFNAKVNFQLPKQQKLFLSCYLGNDYFYNWSKSNLEGQDKRSTLSWGNKTATIRYTNILAPNLFANATVNYNRFSYEANQNSVVDESRELVYDFNKKASVEDFSAKLNFEFYKAKHAFKLGFEAGNHTFQPNRVDYKRGTGSINQVDLSNFTTELKPQTVAIFAEDAIDITPNLSVNVGVRWLNYFLKSKNFQSIEPRALMSYRLNSDSHVDVSFTQMGQYVHLLTSSSGGGFGNDIWVPSTEGVPLEKAQQIALSYGQKWREKGWDFQLETYYKKSENLIDYRQGANLFLFDKNWEQIIEKNGKGRAYGFEFFLKKESRNWNGWLSYTISWSERQFENINGGDWFAQRYDRRHNLNLVYEQKLSKKWTFNADFVFNTGAVFTFPVAVVKNETGAFTALYEKKNNGRLPDYHRMDVAFSRRYLTRRGNEAKWTFSMYNVYGRNNPSIVNYSLGSLDVGEGYKVLLRPQTFFRFVPGISWSIKF